MIHRSTPPSGSFLLWEEFVELLLGKIIGISVASLSNLLLFSLGLNPSCVHEPGATGADLMSELDMNYLCSSGTSSDLPGYYWHFRFGLYLLGNAT